MKKFIYRSFIVGFVFYGLLLVVQFFYDNNLRNSDNSYHKMWNDIATGRINSNLIFTGSSRTLVQYDPNVFSEELDLSSYVLGLDGTGIDLQKVIRDLYLQNNSRPKAIVQNVDLASLGKTKDFFKAPYLPYYSFKNMMTLRETDDSAIAEYLIPMYKYRGHIFDSKSLYKKNSRQADRGYVEMDLEWDGSFEKMLSELDSEKIDLSHIDFEKGFEAIDELVLQTEKIGTKLILLWAPEYFERIPLEEPYFSIYINRFRALEDEYEHVSFLDFSRDSLSYDKEFFYNSYHLNNKGVPVYNKKVADSLKTILTLNTEPNQ